MPTTLQALYGSVIVEAGVYEPERESSYLRNKQSGIQAPFFTVLSYCLKFACKSMACEYMRLPAGMMEGRSAFAFLS